MNDFVRTADDVLEFEPIELRPFVTEVISMGFAKTLATLYKRPWTDQLEFMLQKNISLLVSEARKRGISVVTVTATRVDGMRSFRYLYIDRIDETRSLQ